MPRGRKYLPYGLTAEERRKPALRKKLAKCIRKVEKKSCPKKARRKDGTYNYRACMVNPVAVCRASIIGSKKDSRKRKKR